MIKIRSYDKTGILADSDLKKLNLLPSTKRANQGPVVIIECVQEIPCDQCAAACPKKQ